MEEELNENELEERFYSMLHYVDGSQTNEGSNKDGSSLLESAPRATLRRYWRPADTHHPYKKVNTPKETPTTNKQPPRPNNTTDNTIPKEEKAEAPPEPLPAHLLIFQSTVPQKNSIEIIEDVVEENVVELQSSDEDEVIEVALPPKPTITIESSDEEEITPTSLQAQSIEKPPNREVSASPVPSVVSSVSDEFIRGDCIALNISSRHPDDHSFDFGLHGADLLGQSTPSKKRKKKKNKETTSTPVLIETTPTKSNANKNEECFATPKSKARNKRQRTKSYTVSEKSIPNPDVYDSDSNQSVIDANKTKTSYIVTDKNIPSTDVYESDSASEVLKNTSKQNEIQDIYVDSSDSSEKLMETPIQLKKTIVSTPNSKPTGIVDLTDNSESIPHDNSKSDIQENIVIGNVTGFQESEDYGDDPIPQNNTTNVDPSKFGSTKVPAILYENLDFDNLKGKDKVCKNRRYSLTTLRAEMEKFYNESWGGEDFNHREIQKNMSRDKSLWAIDPKDRMPGITKRKSTCNYCGRVGHRDDMCRFKPPVCYMCGHAGHVEPRCPSKICVNCGSPNNMYSTMCGNCCHWGRVMCSECGQRGHPASHCPDLWRRYHSTIDITPQLEENRYTKKHYQMFCSGCTRRGHMVHTCRISLPFSGLPINSPYVCWYTPTYYPNQENVPQNNQRQAMSWKKQQDGTVSSASVKDMNKRQSKSPTVLETHASKKRNVDSEVTEPKSPNRGRKVSQSKETEIVKVDDTVNVSTTETVPDTETTPDFIPVGSANRDNKGQIIQDNEVSDTTDIVTSARIYITNDIIDKLKTKEGETWLKETTEKFNVAIQNTDIHSFLSIIGKVMDQEAFQTALREWANGKPRRESAKSENNGDITQDSDNDQSFVTDDIPKNRNNVLRKLKEALESLKQDLGDPNAIYKELNHQQNRHKKLLMQKVINPKQLENNSKKINKMLKKLNMVLLGQAGLADGAEHLAALYLLQEKLSSFRNKNISQNLRIAIGEHYHSIFTATPRNDYEELVQSYYGNKTKQSPLKKKKKSLTVKANKMKPFKGIPTQPIDHPKEDKSAKVENKDPKMVKKHLVEKTMKQVKFIHWKLRHARPLDSGLKKIKGSLVSKIYTYIASFDRNPNMTLKMLKKLKKIQEQAQTLLNSV